MLNVGSEFDETSEGAASNRKGIELQDINLQDEDSGKQKSTDWDSETGVNRLNGINSDPDVNPIQIFTKAVSPFFALSNFSFSLQN